MPTDDTLYEYKILSGVHTNKFAALTEELNAHAAEGWELFQSNAVNNGMFGFGTGGLGASLMLILRRPKSS